MPMKPLKVIFERKPEWFQPVPVEIERIIRISGEELDELFQKPYLEYDFIKKHIDDMYLDEKDVYHAILVMSNERVDGLLIESKGAGYARYASYVPCAMIVASPALSSLVNAIYDAANHIVEKGREKNQGVYEFNLNNTDEVEVLCLLHNPVLQENLIEVLLERDEIAEAVIEQDRLVVRYATESQLESGLEL